MNQVYVKKWLVSLLLLVLALIVMFDLFSEEAKAEAGFCSQCSESGQTCLTGLALGYRECSLVYNKNEQAWYCYTFLACGM
jgi:hypothetical protein